ncbi:prolyl 4-hydroxylase 1-like isoform X1 [Musa acuminata AAA Group]|uniref:prolyl 4-hydroxylase 1-like isoform X1 n=1 Tax=Musa acuminata AAA Group TaxID=214697 RepID=UPI0031CE43EF
MARSKYVLPFIAFVAVGMAIGWSRSLLGFGLLFQLAFIWRLEEFSGTNNHWENDKESALLRLGFVKPEILSWSPRIILFHNFLSMEECDYLKSIARPHLEISTVVDPKTGESIKSKVRTSSGMFLSSKDRQIPIIKAIEKRIAVFSQIPAENGESIQVLRYETNQYYTPHHDYFSDAFNLKNGGQRVATMLMYLNDVDEGGETIFPQAGSSECSCGGNKVKGLCMKSRKGDAILFWSMGLDGQSDPNSLHGACPIVKGEKWSATKWLRQGAYS